MAVCGWYCLKYKYMLYYNKVSKRELQTHSVSLFLPCTILASRNCLLQKFEPMLTCEHCTILTWDVEEILAHGKRLHSKHFREFI